MAVLIVLDINDIEGSYPRDIIEVLNSKKISPIVVLNKSDTLPQELSMARLKEFLVKHINEMQPAINGLVV
jgi:ribosome biogenesis GTPase A